MQLNLLKSVQKSNRQSRAHSTSLASSILEGIREKSHSRRPLNEKVARDALTYLDSDPLENSFKPDYQNFLKRVVKNHSKEEIQNSLLPTNQVLFLERIHRTKGPSDLKLKAFQKDYQLTDQNLAALEKKGFLDRLKPTELEFIQTTQKRGVGSFSKEDFEQLDHLNKRGFLTYPTKEEHHLFRRLNGKPSSVLDSKKYRIDRMIAGCDDYSLLRLKRAEILDYLTNEEREYLTQISTKLPNEWTTVQKEMGLTKKQTSDLLKRVSINSEEGRVQIDDTIKYHPKVFFHEKMAISTYTEPASLFKKRSVHSSTSFFGKEDFYLLLKDRTTLSNREAIRLQEITHSLHSKSQQLKLLKVFDHRLIHDLMALKIKGGEKLGEYRQSLAREMENLLPKITLEDLKGFYFSPKERLFLSELSQDLNCSLLKLKELASHYQISDHRLETFREEGILNVPSQEDQDLFFSLQELGLEGESLRFHLTTRIHPKERLSLIEKGMIHHLSSNELSFLKEVQFSKTTSQEISLLALKYGIESEKLRSLVYQGNLDYLSRDEEDLFKEFLLNPQSEFSLFAIQKGVPPYRLHSLKKRIQYNQEGAFHFDSAPKVFLEPKLTSLHRVSFKELDEVTTLFPSSHSLPPFDLSKQDGTLCFRYLMNYPLHSTSDQVRVHQLIDQLESKPFTPKEQNLYLKGSSGLSTLSPDEEKRFTLLKEQLSKQERSESLRTQLLTLMSPLERTKLANSFFNPERSGTDNRFHQFGISKKELEPLLLSNQEYFFLCHLRSPSQAYGKIHAKEVYQEGQFYGLSMKDVDRLKEKGILDFPSKEEQKAILNYLENPTEDLSDLKKRGFLSELKDNERYFLEYLKKENLLKGSEISEEIFHQFQITERDLRRFKEFGHLTFEAIDLGPQKDFTVKTFLFEQSPLLKRREGEENQIDFFGPQLKICSDSNILYRSQWGKEGLTKREEERFVELNSYGKTLDPITVPSNQELDFFDKIHKRDLLKQTLYKIGKDDFGIPKERIEYFLAGGYLTIKKGTCEVFWKESTESNQGRIAVALLPDQTKRPEDHFQLIEALKGFQDFKDLNQNDLFHLVDRCIEDLNDHGTVPYGNPLKGRAEKYLLSESSYGPALEKVLERIKEKDREKNLAEKTQEEQRTKVFTAFHKTFSPDLMAKFEKDAMESLTIEARNRLTHSNQTERYLAGVHYDQAIQEEIERYLNQPDSIERSLSSFSFSPFDSLNSEELMKEIRFHHYLKAIQKGEEGLFQIHHRDFLRSIDNLSEEEKQSFLIETIEEGKFRSESLEFLKESPLTENKELPVGLQEKLNLSAVPPEIEELLGPKIDNRYRKTLPRDYSIALKTLRGEELSWGDGKRLLSLRRSGIHPECPKYQARLFSKPPKGRHHKKGRKDALVEHYQQRVGDYTKALLFTNSFKQVTMDQLKVFGLSEEDVHLMATPIQVSQDSILAGGQLLRIHHEAGFTFYSIDHSARVSGRDFLKRAIPEKEIAEQPQSRNDLLEHDLKVVDSVQLFLKEFRPLIDSGEWKILSIKNEATQYSEAKKGKMNHERQDGITFMDAVIEIEERGREGSSGATTKTIAIEYGIYKRHKIQAKLDHAIYDQAYVYAPEETIQRYQRTLKYDSKRIQFRRI